jgi:hypothetical protein
MSELKLIVPNQEDKEIKETSKAGAAFVAEAESIVVKIKDDAENVSEFIARLNDLIKGIETKRLEFTRPINESLKAINKTFADLKEPYALAKHILTGKLTEWHLKEERRIREENERREREEQRRRKIQESHAARGHDIGDIPIIDSIAPKENKIGRGHVVKRWTFEVTDEGKVPREFLRVDEVIVRERIRTGTREIPGIRIFQEASTIIR